MRKDNPGSMLKFRSDVATALGYAFYLLSNLSFALLFPPFMFLFFWNRPLQYRIACTVYRRYCWFLTRVYLPALGVYTIIEQSGFNRITPSMPAIFIANHRSRIDGPFLIPLLPDTGVIIKSSYARLPFYRSLVRYLDFISVDSSSIDSLADALRECKALLAQGKRLLIFPEGTRSAGARPNVFKDLAFRLSIETDTPVVPIVVHTDSPFMAKIKGSYFPGRRFSVIFRALAPQYGCNDERPGDFAERIRKLMTETLQQLDKGTVWSLLQAQPKDMQHRRRTTSAASGTPAIRESAPLTKGEHR